MMVDIPNERGMSKADVIWDAEICHFPLIDSIVPMSLPWMILLYAILWISKLFILSIFLNPKTNLKIIQVVFSQ